MEVSLIWMLLQSSRQTQLQEAMRQNHYVCVDVPCVDHSVSDVIAASDNKINVTGIITGLVIILLGVIIYAFLLWLRRRKEMEAIRYAQRKRDQQRKIAVTIKEKKKSTFFSNLWKRWKVSMTHVKRTLFSVPPACHSSRCTPCGRGH